MNRSVQSHTHLQNLFINIFALGSFLGILMLLSFVSLARAQVALFVNGDDNCCLHAGPDYPLYMQNLETFLSEQNIEARRVAWNSAEDYWEGSNTTEPVWATLHFIDTLIRLADNLPPRTPLILIGHSFGGDSILKALGSLDARKHYVMFAGVIDAVGFGGYRSGITSRTIPSHVGYFFNRWQTNIPWPIDFYNTGHISCNAGHCNQDEQSTSRNAEGVADRVRCADYEVCDGAHWKWVDCGTLCGYWKYDPGEKINLSVIRRLLLTPMSKSRCLISLVVWLLPIRLVL
jgi:hypothetical protein